MTWDLGYPDLPTSVCLSPVGSFGLSAGWVMWLKEKAVLKEWCTQFQLSRDVTKDPQLEGTFWSGSRVGKSVGLRTWAVTRNNDGLTQGLYSSDLSKHSAGHRHCHCRPAVNSSIYCTMVSLIAGLGAGAVLVTTKVHLASSYPICPRLVYVRYW